MFKHNALDSKPELYTSGGIQFCNSFDDALTWRRLFETVMSSYGIRCVHPPDMSGKSNQHLELKGDNVSVIRKHMRENFIYNDLAISQRASGVVVFWDESARKGCGTHSEATAAFLANVPVFAITDLPLDKLSSWFVGLTTYITDSWFDLIDQILIYYGLDEDLNPWGFDHDEMKIVDKLEELTKGEKVNG